MLSFSKSSSDQHKSTLNILLLIVVYLSFYYLIWAVPLFDLDEGAFSQATLEMFQRHDFLMTYLNGQPRYDKPIFVYWLQALSISAFGINEFAFRLPSAVASTIWMTIVWRFIRYKYHQPLAQMTVIMMASALSITIIAKAATADAVLNACIAGNMLWLWLYLQNGHSKWLYFSTLAMALGFLTKGPIAVLIPAAVSFIYLVSKDQWKQWFVLLFNWKAWLIFIVIAFPWYLALSLRDGSDFLRHFLLDHNLNRADNAMEGHAGHWWYYIPVLILGTLPASSLLLRSFAKIAGYWQNDLSRWCLIWFVFIFVLFSVVATKLPHYIVYGYTALYILMALTLLENPSRKRDGWLFLPALLFFGVLLILPYILQLIHFHREFEQRQIEALSFDWSYYLFVGSAFLFSLFCIFDRKILVSLKFTWICVLFLLVISVKIIPQVANIRQLPIKEAALVAKHYPHDAQIMWKLNIPSFSVYSGAITPRKSPQSGALVFTKVSALSELNLPYQILYKKLGYVLVCLPNEHLFCKK